MQSIYPKATQVRTLEQRAVRANYWAAKIEGLEITPEEAAISSNIDPLQLDVWMDDSAFKKWFYQSPKPMKVALKALAMLALEKGMELLDHKEVEIQERTMKFFIDQQVGKAKERTRDIPSDEEQEEDLSKSLEDLDILEKKLNKLTKEVEDGNDSGETKQGA
jgi:hypothetical protein